MLALLLLCLISSIFNKEDFDLEEVRNDLRDRHNFYRAKHQLGNLERLQALESIAQDYSQILVTLGHLEHSGNKLNGEYIGENLFYGYNAGYLGTTPVNLWYDEIKDYEFNNPGFSSRTGHFTQVIWKNSKQLGCGAAWSSYGDCYVTFNYYPGGNYIGQFEDNVFPLKEPEESDTSTDIETDTTKPEDSGEDKNGKETDYSKTLYSYNGYIEILQNCASSDSHQLREYITYLFDCDSKDNQRIDIINVLDFVIMI